MDREPDDVVQSPTEWLEAKRVAASQGKRSPRHEDEGQKDHDRGKTRHEEESGEHVGESTPISGAGGKHVATRPNRDERRARGARW